MSNEAAVFILLGQSNAVGHGVPMKEDDIITVPLKNVFGLSRELNQSYDNDKLYWTGYTNYSMNLAEEQDNTYSVANCLAKQWQNEIDNGSNLPDLYIVHIAIGAQGVTEKYMWYPKRPAKLIPGVLGTVDISLYPYALHFFSLIEKSIKEEHKTISAIQLHWRGGEEDVCVPKEQLELCLKGVYETIFSGFYEALGINVPTYLHRIVCYDRCMDFDSTGEYLKSLHYINSVFKLLCEEHENIEIFDVTNAPQYIPGVRDNGIFIDDVVHYTPEVNAWVASVILDSYKESMI